MTLAPDLTQLARAIRDVNESVTEAEPAESVEFELHYPDSPPMGFLAADLVLLDREHRRAAEQIAAWRESRDPRRHLPPRRDGLVIKATRTGSFEMGSVPQEAIEAALKNPEGYVNTISRLVRWTKARLRRRGPAGDIEAEDIDIEDPHAEDDRRGELSERSTWRGRWTYPDGTEIEVEFTNEKFE